MTFKKNILVEIRIDYYRHISKYPGTYLLKKPIHGKEHIRNKKHNMTGFIQFGIFFFNVIYFYSSHITWYNLL